jgi:hypothetical protein
LRSPPTHATPPASRHTAAGVALADAAAVRDGEGVCDGDADGASERVPVGVGVCVRDAVAESELEAELDLVGGADCESDDVVVGDVVLEVVRGGVAVMEPVRDRVHELVCVPELDGVSAAVPVAVADADFVGVPVGVVVRAAVADGDGPVAAHVSAKTRFLVDTPAHGAAAKAASVAGTEHAGRPRQAAATTAADAGAEQAALAANAHDDTEAMEGRP